MRALVSTLLTMVLLGDPLIAQSLRKCTIVIIKKSGVQVPLAVEVADTEPARQRGLMHRRSLDRGSGMLFVFTDVAFRSFWMKNTFIPLTIAYIDTDGVITDLHDMRPLDTSVLYSSRYPSRYALEVNRGWFRDNDISIGARVLIDGCLGK